MSTTISVPSRQCVYRIRNWQQYVGTPGRGLSTGLKARFSRMTLSGGSATQTLIRKRLFGLPQGIATFGVWALLMQVAAETSVPGAFLDDDIPLTVEDLALITDVSVEEMRVALENLMRPEIRLIEMVDLEDVLTVEAEESLPPAGYEAGRALNGRENLAGNEPEISTANDASCNTHVESKSLPKDMPVGRHSSTDGGNKVGESLRDSKRSGHGVTGLHFNSGGVKSTSVNVDESPPPDSEITASPSGSACGGLPSPSAGPDRHPR